MGLRSSSSCSTGKSTAILSVGFDLAKNDFAAHGVNDAGKPELVKTTVSRTKLNGLLAELPPNTIDVEARFGAHQWAREVLAYGHTVKLIAPRLQG